MEMEMGMVVRVRMETPEGEGGRREVKYGDRTAMPARGGRRDFDFCFFI